MTKAVVAKNWILNSWSDGTNRSYPEPPNSFIANFSTDENPLRRAGYSQDVFVEGATDALQWSNMKTVGGRVHCANNVGSGFADNMACLNRALIVIPAKQFVQGTIYVSATAGAITNTQEMELFGRMTLSANLLRGYEIDLSRDSNAIFIVKHGVTSGVINDFTILTSGSVTIGNGDVFRAEFVNSGSDVIITVFKNGTQVLTTTDVGAGANWQSGNCGIAGLMRSDNVLDYGVSAWSCGGF